MTTHRSVIVTGGASGIGKAAAQLLARAGDAVTIADLDVTAGEQLARNIASVGGRAQFVRTDVTNEENVRAMVARAVSTFGKLDAAINSAGVPQRGRPLHELTAEDWDFCNGINLRGMFLCLKHEIAAMLGTGGAIVAVSSAAAVKGLINSTDYCASKAGVTGLVRGAAVDYAEAGIRINALLPGGTDTPLAHRSSAANPKVAQQVRIPVGRLATPEEIAASAVWMISDQASYMTGACVVIDGGMTIV
ncbi:MAG: SDR family oxidoreductase [Steroidobacteraceae bacterium]